MCGAMRDREKDRGVGASAHFHSIAQEQQEQIGKHTARDFYDAPSNHIASEMMGSARQMLLLFPSKQDRELG
jgi:hypothetical protein